MVTKAKASKRGRIEDAVKFDTRLRTRNLRDGVLNRTDVDKYLKGLSDVGVKAESLGNAKGEERKG